MMIDKKLIKKIYSQVDEYLDYCENVRGMSKQTMASKAFILNHFKVECGVDDLAEFDNHAMNAWIAFQSSLGVSGRTINTRMAHVIALVKYHREMGLDIPIRLTFVQKVPELPPRRNYYTRGQITEALSCANDMEWLMIRICFDTGMRLSELTNLRVSNFAGNRIVYIGKGRKRRESFICNDTLYRLNEYCEKHGIVDYLWPSPVDISQPYSTDEVRYIMGRPFRRASITGFHPHALRHSFGTDIQLHGASAAEAQQLLGHSKLETTERYLHGFDNQLSELFRKYKPELAQSL